MKFDTEKLVSITTQVRAQVAKAEDDQLEVILDEHLPAWRSQPWTHTAVELRKYPPRYERMSVVYRTEVLVAERSVGNIFCKVTMDGEEVSVDVPKKAPV